MTSGKPSGSPVVRTFGRCQTRTSHNLRAWMEVEDKIRSTALSTCKIAPTTDDSPLDPECPRECELFWTLISLDRNLLTAITRFVVFVSPSCLAMELVLTLSNIVDILDSI